MVRSSSSPAEEEEEATREPMYVVLDGSRRPPAVASGRWMDVQYDSGEQEVSIVIRWQASGIEVARVHAKVDTSLSVGHLWTWARAHRTVGRHAKDAELEFALKDDTDEPTPGGEPMTHTSMNGKLFLRGSVRDRLRAKQAAEPDSTPVLDFTLMRRSVVPNPTSRTNVIFD